MSKPRVLIWDIETSPLLSYTWGIWQQDVIKVKEDWQILSVAWKWLGEKQVHVLGQDDFPGYKPGVNNDFMVVAKIRQLLDEADIVIAHNGDQFDQKKAIARIIIRGLTPPSPYKQIDTKKVAKRYGAFTSNRLKDLAEAMDVARKGSPGGFETWEGCLAGDPKAWAKMKKYNKQDIPPLEEIYLKLRPFMDNHPGMNLYSVDNFDKCPKCGGGPLHKRGTKKTTKVGVVQRYQCQNCDGWSQARRGEKTEVQFVN